MELHQALVPFAAFAAATLLSTAGNAQLITINPAPTRDPGDNYPEQDFAYHISRQDCLDNDVFIFDLTLSGTGSNQLEVWVGDSDDCTINDERNGTDASCWQVYTGNAEDGAAEVHIAAQDIAYFGRGARYPLDSSEAQCTSDERSIDGDELTLYFMLIDGSTADVTATFDDISLDVRGPNPPTEATAEAGENRLPISWTLNDPDDWDGYVIFCVPEDVDPENPGLRPLAPGDGGAGGVGGATLTTGDAGTTSTNTAGSTSTSSTASIPDKCLFRANNGILVEGEVPSQEVIATYQCGSGTSGIATNGTATGLRNGVLYQVAVAGRDRLGNVGPLSNVACNTPVEVDTFFEVYKESGGEGGGGFCSFALHRTPGSLVLLSGAALVLVARRRRRRHG